MTDKKVIAGILLVGPEPPIARRMFNSSDLILYFDKYGVLESKDFYDKNDLKEIKFSKKTTENNLSKRSFVENFLQSVKKKMYGTR